MSEKIPSRTLWAVDLLNILPDQKILEIGCGFGFAVFAISAELETGCVTAIDSSAKMIAATCDLNRENIERGKCEILQLDWLAASSLGKRFDTIFVYNMNVLWMDPKAELEIVTKLLTDNGRFFIFHQPPPGNDPREYAAEFEKNLTANNFNIETIEFNDDESIRSVCVATKPTRR